MNETKMLSILKTSDVTGNYFEQTLEAIIGGIDMFSYLPNELRLIYP